MRMFEWLTLARRPMELVDLRYAICLKAGERYQSIRQLEDEDSGFWCCSDEVLVNRAIAFSGGLIKKAIAQIQRPGWRIPQPGKREREGKGSYRECNVLQFDHQSVHDYMVQSGLQVLASRLSKSTTPVSIAESHLSLATKCLQYLQVKEVVEYGLSNVRLKPSLAMGGVRFLHDKPVLDVFPKTPPLALYAALQWSEHMRLAEENCVDTDVIVGMLARMPAGIWTHVAQMEKVAIFGNRIDTLEDSCAMHVICTRGLGKTLATMLYRGNATKSEPGKHRFSQQLEARNKGGQTPLSVAAEEGHCHIVDLLLRSGAKPNSTANGGLTPLHFAAGEGHLDVVRSLVAAKTTDVDAPAILGGMRPIDFAVSVNNLAVVEFLLAASTMSVHADGAGVAGYTTLHHAFAEGSVEVMKALLNSNKIDSRLQDNFGDTILHFVSSFVPIGGPKHNRTALARLLVESGKFALNVRNNNGETPVAMAAWQGEVEVVKLLLARRDIDIEAKDKRGDTPLLLAIGQHHPNVVALLLNTGIVCMDVRNVRGLTPLLIAVVSGCFESVKLLISTGRISIHEPASDGTKPLVLAARLSRNPPDRAARRKEIFDFLRRCVGQLPA
ncbi:hypothetical protein LTR36_007432 [Oleoguttula mirabilis]|uniref:Uncharacterized protein n=1 Tax=Oleoguttula mirabilis TaxID=1507867 RepID=A0AAV9J9Q7_9PEZI|nr:hypothetical protein LTR36_007432 [Oleoguttula mirabilis]